MEKNNVYSPLDWKVTKKQWYELCKMHNVYDDYEVVKGCTFIEAMNHIKFIQEHGWRAD